MSVDLETEHLPEPGPADALTGPPSRPLPDVPSPPLRQALRPYAGPIAILSLLLACLMVGTLIGLIGARQPRLVVTSADAPTDSFNRDDSLVLGGEWATVGNWGIFNGTAALSEPEPSGSLSAATVEVGSPDADVSAKLLGIDGDGGLVFRYTDPSNYGLLVPQPTFGTWSIRIVVGGSVVEERNIGLRNTAEGTLAGIVTNGQELTVLLNNQIAYQFDMPAGFDGTRFGFGSMPDRATRTRFDDFSVRSKEQR